MIHGWAHLRPEDREQILRGLADGNVYGGPYHIELDWVDKCNARCFFCNSENLHNGESIPWPRAQALLEEAVAHELRSIRLSGGGEPTLHPQFCDLLRLLGTHDVMLDNLTTNGAQLTERVIDALLAVRVNEAKISLNYCDEETYAKGMGLPAHFFGRVVQMARRLGAARRERGRIRKFALQFLVYKPTMHQIRRMYDLGCELGADVIHFRELWGIDPALYFAPEDLPAIVEQFREVIREDWPQRRVCITLESHGANERIRQLYDEIGGELGGRSEWAPPRFDLSIRYCYIGWYSMTIIGNQAVYPCCYLLPYSALPALDSVREKTLQQVWRGEAYGRFRREMREFFLLQERAPDFDKRMKTIAPGCHTHHECPITTSMCDEDFYEEADRRLESARRGVGVAARRLANKTGRLFARRPAATSK